jgi:hypothetical protein
MCHGARDSQIAICFPFGGWHGDRFRRGRPLKKVLAILFDSRLRIHLKEKLTADSCDNAWDPLHGTELLPELSRHRASSYLNPRIPQVLDHSRHRQLAKRRQSRYRSKSNNELLPSQLSASATSASSRTSTMAKAHSAIGSWSLRAPSSLARTSRFWTSSMLSANAELRSRRRHAV